MIDKTEAMDNLIAQDADLIEICPDDLVQRLRYDCELAQNLGAQASIVLQAADVRTTLDRIEAQAAEIEKLRAALKDYAERCVICGGRGSFVQEDKVTGAHLWSECHVCKPAIKALEQST